MVNERVPIFVLSVLAYVCFFFSLLHHRALKCFHTLGLSASVNSAADLQQTLLRRDAGLLLLSNCGHIGRNGRCSDAIMCRE